VLPGGVFGRIGFLCPAAPGRLAWSMLMKKIILLSVVLALLPVGTAQSMEPSYTPSQIDELILAGSAKEHGAHFANQGLGCKSFLWKESVDRHIFVFRRDGVSYGEFRDEVLLDGRFMSIIERYLVADLRKPAILSKARVLRFVCKETIPVWKDKVFIESKVRWSFLTTDLNGNILKRDATTKKRMIRGVVNVVVPDYLTPDGQTFFLGLKRKNLTPHESAFGAVNPVFEHFGLVNRRSSIWAEWPDDDAEFRVVLSKKAPNPPQDATPFVVRTERVATMTINLGTPKNTPFVFVADKPILR